jgi:hypothetical protein
MKHALNRWRWRFICWFHSDPDALSRRVAVENVLLTHFKNNTRPTPDECRQLAFKLGVPTRIK